MIISFCVACADLPMINKAVPAAAALKYTAYWLIIENNNWIICIYWVFWIGNCELIITKSCIEIFISRLHHFMQLQARPSQLLGHVDWDCCSTSENQTLANWNQSCTKCYNIINCWYFAVQIWKRNIFLSSIISCCTRFKLYHFVCNVCDNDIK